MLHTTARLLALLALVSPAALAAQSAPVNPPGNTAPVAVLPVDAVPPSRDIPYPGTLRLEVDASDTLHKLFRVRQTIPVAQAGRMTLMLPKWLPGKHAARGAIDRIAELRFFADGKPIPWVRDSLEPFAFHIDVPAGTREVEARFTTLTALTSTQGRTVITPELLNLQWEMVSLYPAGYYVRQIPIVATLTLPAGWQAATALRPTASQGNRITYERVSYENLQDSPVFAGLHMRRDALGHDATLVSLAHDPAKLKAPPEVIAKYRAMVDQTVKLFGGSRHYDHYDFLSALTDTLGGIGLEHHRSTEITSDPDALIKYEDLPDERGVYPHEFVHSWIGKFRRPADLYTPDFHVPMRDSLLWVYEGQTTFWGNILEARSGMSSKQDKLDDLALTAAYYDTMPGRAWRPLIDTTNDPIITARKPQPWGSLLRNEDYYSEGMLMWLEADAIIRRGTGMKRGMDDFARAFFGIRDGDWGVVPYTREDVVAAMNAVYPYDWTGFFAARVDQVQPRAPLAGLTLSGYALEFRDTPNASQKKSLAKSGGFDFAYSLALSVSKEGKVESLRYGGPAYTAGLTVNDEIIAVGSRSFTREVLRDAVVAAKSSRRPIALTVKRGQSVLKLDLAYYDGMRFAHLVKTGQGEGPLDLLLKPR